MSTRKSLTPSLAIITTAALCLATAACSGSGSGSGGFMPGAAAKTTSAAGGTNSSGSMPTAVPSAGAAGTGLGSGAGSDSSVPSGTLLKEDLVTTGMPTGYALVASASHDSGSEVGTPLDVSTFNCSDLDEEAWVMVAGFGSVSYAQSQYQGSQSGFVGQEIDAFQGTTAQTVMATLAGIAMKCPSYTDSETKSTVHISTTQSNDLNTVVLTLTDSAWGTPDVAEAVRVGNVIVSAVVSTGQNNAPLASSLTQQLAANVQNSQG